jgi:myo-inositol-1(or 4)-monophosphatase
MHPMLNMAVKAARRAGSIITRASEDISVLTVNDKGYNDFVSEVDLASEQAIIDVLRRAYPSHAFMGEESGLTGEAENIWIIDPLDGTTNFLHNYPQYSISIALQCRGEITQAVVYDPNSNDRRIRVSKKTKMKECLIGTGFPFRDFTHLPCYLKILEELIRETSGIRRPGSAALDLAYTAAGRFDGFFEIGLSKWDIAAGGLLLSEAGGIVSDFSGKDDWINSGNIIASTPKIYESFVKIINKYLSKELKS